jgi:hypothetical protein
MVQAGEDFENGETDGTAAALTLLDTMLRHILVR